MRSILSRLLPVVAVLALSGCVIAQPVPGPVVGGGYGYETLPPNYYDYLYGYGAWQTVPGYGAMWYPSAGPGWSPYVYGPGASWGFTFYFGDWIQTPYGWGWLPGHEHHTYWRRWAYRGHPERWRDRDDRWRDRGDRWRDRGDRWRHDRRRERWVTPRPPRRAWSPSVRETPDRRDRNLRLREQPRDRRPPVFRSRVPDSRDTRPRVERRREADRPRGHGRGVDAAPPRHHDPSGPSPGFRPPAAPIADRPMRNRPRHDGRSMQVDAPRRAFAPGHVNAPAAGRRSGASAGVRGGERRSRSPARGWQRGQQ